VTLLGVKRLLLAFWALWTTLVCATNVLDGLKALQVLPAGWAFSSANYPFMVKTTQALSTPGWLVAFLFTGVILWEGWGACLFWQTFLTFKGHKEGAWREVGTSFAVNLGLWMAFMIADEVFLAYAVENTHRGIFAAQLLTLLAVRLLPDE
jgi:hypothetical protein